MKEFDELQNVIDNLGWYFKVSEADPGWFYVLLSKESPMYQDFNIEIHTDENIDTFIEEIYSRYICFDVSYETYLWLDSEGHGKNGAPYDMRDVYNDMEWCKEEVKKLWMNLKNKIQKIEY